MNLFILLLFILYFFGMHIWCLKHAYSIDKYTKLLLYTSVIHLKVKLTSVIYAL